MDKTIWLKFGLILCLSGILSGCLPTQPVPIERGAEILYDQGTEALCQYEIGLIFGVPPEEVEARPIGLTNGYDCLTYIRGKRYLCTVDLESTSYTRRIWVNESRCIDDEGYIFGRQNKF